MENSPEDQPPAAPAVADPFRPAPNESAFPATQWSMIVRAGGPDTSEARSALEHLCRQYWFPLYSFVRRQGRSHHEAEDCTQEFLARLLAAEGVGRARREQGRFRTFLLAGLRNFLTNEWHRSQAAKRGGGHVLLSLEFTAAEETYSREPADPGLTPEQIFDRAWALGMIERAIGGLKKDYENSGRGVLFDAIVPLVWGDKSEALAATAARLGMNTHAFTVALARLRQRVAQRLRADVVATVANSADVDGELRHLIAAVSAREKSP
ncbi:MAG: polymerase sigma factor, sigma-70 family [Verrucomicrobia bacterium]|nr:polymerase sigma factor, sigma-70 family [Verrucomicrobiota bacterium]